MAKEFSAAGGGGWRAAGPTLVEASAGTGKTYSIQSAYLRLVLEKGCRVGEILVVTFTEAATAELREKLRAVLKDCEAELGKPQGERRRLTEALGAGGCGASDGELRERIRRALAEYDGAAVHTIHGFCNRVLTRYGFEAHHESDPELMTEPDTVAAEEIRNQWRALDYDGGRGTALFGSFRDFEAQAKQVLKNPDAELGAEVAQEAAEALRGLSRKYWARLKRENVLTFDGMLRELRGALKAEGPGGALHAAVRAEYKAALIDEFQDTDGVQYDIFRMLFWDNATPLLFVGDPKQAIYSFRGGDVHMYNRAKADVERAGGELYTLGTNYRSDPTLLEGFNEYFEDGAGEPTFQGAGMAYSRLESGAAKCGLAELTGTGDARFVLWKSPCKKKPEGVRTVLEASADEIVRLLDDPNVQLGGRRLDPGDIAVLMATNAECEKMLEILRGRGVNAVCVRASNLQGTEAAKAMRWILRALLSPRDSRALRGALGLEILPSGVETLKKLREGDAAAQRELEAWSGLFEEAGALWEREGFMGAWRLLKERRGVEAHVLGLADGEQTSADLEQVAEWLHRRGREVAGGAGRVAGDYEQWLSGDDRGETPDGEGRRLADDEPAVQVMTIHKSKGLEFPVVFVPTLWGKGPRQKHEGFWVRHRGGKKELCLDESAKEDAEKESGEERRRLAYVALTRAKNRLYLVHMDGWRGWEKAVVAELTKRWKELGGEKTVIEEKEGPNPEDPPRRLAVKKVELREAAAMPEVDSGNGRASFSGMTAGLHGGAERVEEVDDRDEADTDAADEGGAGAGMFALPGGTQTGLCLHELFERLDFTQAATHGRVVEEMLRRYGLTEHAEVVKGMVATVLNSPLGGGVRLSAVGREKRISEMTFDFPMRRERAGDLAGVADVLDRHWTGEEAWKREVTRRLRAAGEDGRRIARGYMTGAIDLVFRAGGKFHVVDWKSNRLGGNAGDFGREGLEREMARCLYPLQYLIYVTALDGYLKGRVDGYEYERDMGPVHYLFVRGMDGRGRGVFEDRPSRETIEALGDYLRGK